MKFLADLLPVILFFAAYQVWDIYAATAAAVATAAMQIGVALLLRRRIETLQWVTLGLLVVFGGMTLALHDPLFIKWKPTVVNWLFAAAFLGWMLVRDETLLQRMLGDAMRLPEAVWRRLNGAWILFFCATGILNLVVAYRFTEPTWVNFKLFGLTGLTLLFILAQGLYLVRHVEEPEAPLAEE